MRETWVRSLGWEDPLKKGKTTHASILAWRIHSPWGRKESDMTERLSLSLSVSQVKCQRREAERTAVGGGACGVQFCREQAPSSLLWGTLSWVGTLFPLKTGTAPHSSILAWRIPWTVYSTGSQRVGHDWTTFTLVFPEPHCLSEFAQTYVHWVGDVMIFKPSQQDKMFPCGSIT